MQGFNQSGYAFDTPTEIHTYAQFMDDAIQNNRMPLNNATGMTADERTTFHQWFVAGASTQ